MFTSQNVACYLNGFSGHGDDTESKELKLMFHVVGISKDLASEVSPQIADRLFRKNAEEEWVPAEELVKASFSGITVPTQNMIFRATPESQDRGVMVEGCNISNLRASRPFVEARLEFDVVIPMDHSTMRLIEKYYKATCFLTMEEIQRELELPPADHQQVEHQDLLQDAADGAADDSSAAAGDGKRKRRKKETVNV
jgi:hypothetical protein